MGKRPVRNVPGVIIPFPGGKGLPPQKPDIEPFPVRDAAEQAALQIQMGAMRGELSVQHMRMLARHEQLVADWEHSIRVYLRPHDYVDVTGLSAEEAQDKVSRVQHAALALALPTERDTLSGAFKTLNASYVTIIQLQRLAMGFPAKGGRPAGRGTPGADAGDDDEAEPGVDLEQLPLTTLRDVHAAMRVMTGHKERASEPPMPPPPESLDDLVVVRPPEDPPEPVR